MHARLRAGVRFAKRYDGELTKFSFPHQRMPSQAKKKVRLRIDAGPNEVEGPSGKAHKSKIKGRFRNHGFRMAFW